MEYDELDDQSVAGDDGSADQSGQPRKTSRSARYKAQRDRAYAALKAMEARQSALESKLDQVLGTLQEKQTPADPTDPWASMSDQELMALVNNPEQLQENPQLVNTALIKLNERRVQQAIQQAKQELHRDVASTIVQKDIRQEVRQKVLQEFGDDAFSDDSELFQLASAKYTEYEQRYGTEKIQSMPDFVYLSYQEAARELGIEKSQKPEPEPVPSDMVSARTQTRRVRPDASELAVSRSDGHAQRASEIEALAKKGDTAGVFRSAVRQLFSQG